MKTKPATKKFNRVTLDTRSTPIKHPLHHLHFQAFQAESFLETSSKNARKRSNTVDQLRGRVERALDALTSTTTQRARHKASSRLEDLVTALHYAQGQAIMADEYVKQNDRDADKATNALWNKQAVLIERGIIKSGIKISMGHKKGGR